MTNEEKHYKEMTITVAKAAHEQVKEIASELKIKYSDAMALLQTITVDKLTYGIAQTFSPEDNRSAVDGEHINEDAPSNSK
tara:strand:- start:1123 stop:1365 length:243 start_codon:yes stop_codon:yes gene_type:complete